MDPVISFFVFLFLVGFAVVLVLGLGALSRAANALKWARLMSNKRILRGLPALLLLPLMNIENIILTASMGDMLANKPEPT